MRYIDNLLLTTNLGKINIEGGKTGLWMKRAIVLPLRQLTVPDIGYWWFGPNSNENRFNGGALAEWTYNSIFGPMKQLQWGRGAGVKRINMKKLF